MSVHVSARAGAIAVATLAGIATSAHAEDVFGVTANQTLISFDSATPGVVNTGAAITGLMTNEQVRGIDFRPATGELYALGSFSNLYVLDTATGAATLVGAGSFTPALNGSSFGFDFNPTIDRIRVVSEAKSGGTIVLQGSQGAARSKAEEYMRKQCPSGYEVVEEGDSAGDSDDSREWRIAYRCNGSPSVAMIAY